MNTIKLGIAVLVAFTTVAPALADTIRCESSNGRENYCRGNTRGGVYLSTQLSSSGCYQGDTWGYDNGGVWVNAGCRAIFQTGGYNGYNYHSSNNYNSNYDNNYNNHNKNNSDGAVAAVALAAIIGAAVVASSSNKNKSNSGDSYETTYNNGCNAGNKDRGAGKSRDYTRHSSSYSGSNEQAYSSGYNKCWSN